MTPRDVDNLARFMAAMTEASRDRGVYVGAYSSVDVRVAENAVVSMRWDEDNRHYRIEDRNGD